MSARLLRHRQRPHPIRPPHPAPASPVFDRVFTAPLSTRSPALPTRGASVGAGAPGGHGRHVTTEDTDLTSRDRNAPAIGKREVHVERRIEPFRRGALNGDLA